MATAELLLLLLVAAPTPAPAAAAANERSRVGESMPLALAPRRGDMKPTAALVVVPLLLDDEEADGAAPAAPTEPPKPAIVLGELRSGEPMGVAGIEEAASCDCDCD
jgi:hypothetical protein